MLLIIGLILVWCVIQAVIDGHIRSSSHPKIDGSKYIIRSKN